MPLHLIIPSTAEAKTVITDNKITQCSTVITNKLSFSVENIELGHNYCYCHSNVNMHILLNSSCKTYRTALIINTILIIIEGCSISFVLELEFTKVMP